MNDLLEFLATMSKAELADLLGVCVPEHRKIISNEIGKRNDQELKEHLQKERMSRMRQVVNSLEIL